jgi:hypothetical protein
MRVADDLTVSQNRTPHRKTGHRQRWIEGKSEMSKQIPAALKERLRPLVAARCGRENQQEKMQGREIESTLKPPDRRGTGGAT